MRLVVSVIAAHFLFWGGWLRQLGPNLLPVFGIPNLARNCTLRCLLNGNRSYRLWAANAIPPMTNLVVFLRANTLAELGYG